MQMNQPPQILTVLILSGILSLATAFTPVQVSNSVAVKSKHSSVTPLFHAQGDRIHSLPSSVSNAVLRDIVKRTGIALKKLIITNYTSETWTDGCLGLAKPEEFCTQALISGWKVVVSDHHKTWIYRTNNKGSNVRLETQYIRRYS